MSGKILFLLLCCCLACRNEAPPPAYHPNEIDLSVRTMFRNYFDAVNTRGLLAEFDFLDSSSDFFWVPPGFESSITIDSVKTILRANATAIDSVHFQWESLHVYPQTNELAAYTGIVKTMVRDTAQQVRTMRLIESGLVVRRMDGWKLLCGQSRSLESHN